MGHPPPKWMVILGSDVPATHEYLRHPDHRQYATFFLGWLFILSQILFLTSPTLTSIILRLTRAHNPLNVETRSTTNASAEKSIPTTTSSSRSDSLALVLLLNLLILTTSATQFASLLAFNSSNGETSCVFLTAWNGLGVQAVRLVGFLKLGLHLKELGTRKWESWLLWGLLLFSAVLMFLTNAVSTGTLQPIPGVEGRSFCNHGHYAFTAGLTSAINLFIELYIITRFITLQLPFFLIRRDRRVFADLRLLRALSLLLLDLLTVYPSIHFVSIAADYIPSAIGMIPVLLSFNHQPSRGYSVSPSSGWSTKSTSLSQPPAFNGSTARSLDHILPMHTPPSTFEVRSSEYVLHSDGSSVPAYPRPQTHPFGAIALKNQSDISGYPYLTPVHRGAMDSESPVVTPRPLLAVPVVDGQSSIIDTSSIPRRPSNADLEGSIRTSASRRRSFLPALPTMAWGTEVEAPLNVEPVQPPPSVATKESALAPARRTRQILPNQAEIAAELPRRKSPGFTPLMMALGLKGHGASASSATTLPVPPGSSGQPRIALSSKPISPVLEEDDTSKDPDCDAPTTPSPPISVMYGSDILSPSAELVDVMKRAHSTTNRSRDLSHVTTARQTYTSVGTWSTRFSTTESMALNYPLLAPPLSPGIGELTASSGSGSYSRRPSTAEDSSRKSEGGEKRPNTFGKESFLDFKVLFTSSRASSTKTKSSNHSSHSTEGPSRSHSETDESPGTRSKREKGKGSRKARRTPVGAGVANREQPQRNRNPSPPQATAPEGAAP